MGLREELWVADRLPTGGAESAPAQEWLDAGMVALFDQRIGREVIEGAMASANTGTRAVARRGEATDYSGTANTQYPHRAAYALNGPMSIVVFCEVDALTGYGALISKLSAADANGWELRVGGTAPTNAHLLLIRANTGSRGYHTNANRIAAGYAGAIVNTHPGGGIENGGSVYWDGGESAQTTAAGTGTGAATDTGGAVWIGRRIDGTTQLDGRIYYAALFNRELSPTEARSIIREPARLFAPQSIWVPASAGGGAITIDGNVGGATAAGIAGQVGVSIDITGSVGNAAAAGTTGLPGVSIGIDATTGNAGAAGVFGVVDLGGNISIDGNVGAAVAVGVQGLPGVDITVSGSVGAASAAGISGTVSLSNDITINGSVGNAAAAGILASLALEINLAGSVGNATAAGVAGTVTLSGAEVFSASPLVQRLETSTRIARTSASRSARLQPRNR